MCCWDQDLVLSGKLHPFLRKLPDAAEKPAQCGQGRKYYGVSATPTSPAVCLPVTAPCSLCSRPGQNSSGHGPAHLTHALPCIPLNLPHLLATLRFFNGAPFCS